METPPPPDPKQGLSRSLGMKDVTKKTEESNAPAVSGEESNAPAIPGEESNAPVVPGEELYKEFTKTDDTNEKTRVPLKSSSPLNALNNGSISQNENYGVSNEKKNEPFKNLNPLTQPGSVGNATSSAETALFPPVATSGPGNDPFENPQPATGPPAMNRFSNEVSTPANAVLAEGSAVAANTGAENAGPQLSPEVGSAPEAATAPEKYSGTNAETPAPGSNTTTPTANPEKNNEIVSSEEQSTNGNHANNDAKHIIVVDENISLKGLEKISQDFKEKDDTFMVMKPKNVQTIIDSKPCNNPESSPGVSNINNNNKHTTTNPLHQGGNPQPKKRSMKRIKPKKKGAAARKTQMKIKQKKTRNKIKKQIRKTKRKR